MANTTIKFKRLLGISQQLSSSSSLTAGEPLWFGSSWYTNSTPKLLVGDTSGTPTFVGPYYGGTGVTIDNDTTSTTLGRISIDTTDLQNTYDGSTKFAIGGYPASVTHTGIGTTYTDLNLAEYADVYYSNQYATTTNSNDTLTSILALGWNAWSNSVANGGNIEYTSPNIIFYGVDSGDPNAIHSLTIAHCKLNWNTDILSFVDYSNNTQNNVYTHYLPTATGLLLQHTMLTADATNYNIVTSTGLKNAYAPVVYSTHNSAGELSSNTPKKLAVPITNNVIASAIKTKSSLVADTTNGEVGANNVHFDFGDYDISDNLETNDNGSFTLLTSHKNDYQNINNSYTTLTFDQLCDLDADAYDIREAFPLVLPYKPNTDTTSENTHYLLLRNNTSDAITFDLTFQNAASFTDIVGDTEFTVPEDESIELRVKATPTGLGIITRVDDNIAYIGEDEGQAGGILSTPVNDATITLQVNGTTVDSFTVNAANNKTINLPISGGSGSGDTVVGKSNVTLGTTATAVLQVNGTDSGSVALPSASTSGAGIVQLSSSTSSTSTSTAATPSAVKSAYDLANNAIPKSVGTTAGDIIYFTGSSTPTRLAKGTAGQVLTMNSGATAPEWQTPSSGSVTEVVWCSYNTGTETMSGLTAAEMYTNVTNGKVVLCKVDDNRVYNLINYDHEGSSYTLSFVGCEGDSIYTLSTSTGSTWVITTNSIPTVPTNVSSFTNDAGYTTNTGTITGITMNNVSKGTSGVVDLGTVITSHQSIKTVNGNTMTGSGNVTVQETLVSGTNIKTVNNTTLLGSGNIDTHELPTVSSSDNGKILEVSSGSWAAVMPVTIYTGTGSPSSGTGSNGDIYIQTAS